MTKTVKIALAVIGLLAILVSYGIFQFLSAERTVIYLFNANHRAGTLITPEILIEEEIETDIIRRQLQMRGPDDPRFVTEHNLEHFIGTHLRTDVMQGMVLISSYSVDFAGSPAEMGLSPNNVGLAIPVDNITVTNPLMTQGARVNIYAGIVSPNEAGEAVSFTIPFTQYTRVLDVLYDSMGGEGGTPTVSGIIVELTPQEALVLAHYIKNGTVRVGIVRPGNYEPVPLEGIETIDIVNQDDFQEVLSE